MKKLASLILLILFLCLVFTSCTSKDGLESIGIVHTESQQDDDSNNNNSLNINQIEHDDLDYNYDIPNLSIEYSNQMYSAVTGTYSWNITQGENGIGLEGDAGSPEVLIKQQVQPILIDENGEISFVFDRQPVSYEVKIWNTENYELSQIIDVNDDKIKVTKNQINTIYEVIADFELENDGIEESGKVYYAFVINQKN